MKILKIMCISVVFISILIVNVFATYDLSINDEVEVVSIDILNDLPNNVDKESFKYLIDKEALLVRNSGVEPFFNITREDFLTMMFRLVEGYKFYSISESPYYFDVSPRDWFAGYVEWARYNGVARGIDLEVWGIGYEITREQLCKMLYGYFEFKGYDTGNIEYKDTLIVKNEIKDFANVSDWAKESVKWCYSMKLLSVDSLGNINPTNFVELQEAVKILSDYDRILEKCEVL